jgi:phosphate-selective porin OprO/OprP
MNVRHTLFALTIGVAPSTAIAQQPDSVFQLRFGGVLQADSRFYSEDPRTPAVNSFLLRRARPITEALFDDRYLIRIMPDFGNGKVVLFDAYGEVRFAKWLSLRVGKFKPPVGLEELQTDVDLRFVERGLPSDLAPTRDVGWQLSGSSGSGAIAYQIGAFDGVPDLGNGDGSTGNSTDVAGRILLRPFQWVSSSPAVDVGVGIAGSSGAAHGTPAAPVLAT